MPFKDAEERRSYFKTYMRKRRSLLNPLRRNSVKPEGKPVNPVKPITTGRPVKPSVAQEAISSTPTPPALISTHRFCIIASRRNSGSVEGLGELRYKGAGRIKYATIDLANCSVEFYPRSVILIAKGEIVNADEARVAALKAVLSHVSEKRNVGLVEPEKWRVGQFSHNVMEDEGLNEFFMPLAKANWGDKDLHLYLDESHTGRVESAGKRNYEAAENLRFMLLEFPKSFHAYNENIVKHLAVLDEMSKTLKMIQEDMKKKG